MEVVYLEPLDKKDLLEILDYALEKKTMKPLNITHK